MAMLPIVSMQPFIKMSLNTESYEPINEAIRRQRRLLDHHEPPPPSSSSSSSSTSSTSSLTHC
ncbi:hypothetical protein BLOT_001247 [Blomia tropicalis]|nr:hypothetical protein BLOT_001247 [Blomia tropicalis]